MEVSGKPKSPGDATGTCFVAGSGFDFPTLLAGCSAFLSVRKPLKSGPWMAGRGSSLCFPTPLMETNRYSISWKDEDKDLLTVSTLLPLDLLHRAHGRGLPDAASSRLPFIRYPSWVRHWVKCFKDTNPFCPQHRGIITFF